MKKIIVGLVSVLLVTGCATTPTGNIEAFGNAAKGVTDKIDNVIKDYNEGNIDNELTKLAQHRKPITSSSLEPVKSVLIGQSDKKNYALYKANHALGAYAEALAGLARSGGSDEFDLAATKLYASLHGFNEQYKTLADTSDNLIKDEVSASVGKVIAAVGSAYAEKKRGDAIKHIVISADPYIQTIGDVIIKELLKGVIEERLYTIKHTELSGYIRDYNSKVASASFQEKKAFLDEIYSKYLAMQSSSASVKQAIKAIKEVKKTHSTLRKELASNKFSSKELIRSIGRLKDLESHYDDLGELMLSCGTEVVADDSKGLVCKEGS